MKGTISVHQCLFCPETFSSSATKDEHILEHFAQETCADCDQNLIRIGAKLYTLHDAVTCIKRENKKNYRCLTTCAKMEQSLVPNENLFEHGCTDNDVGINNTLNQDINIKTEPELNIKTEPELNIKIEPEMIIDMPENDELNDISKCMYLNNSQETQTQMENDIIMVNECQCTICQSTESLREHMKWSHDPKYKISDIITEHNEQEQMKLEENVNNLLKADEYQCNVCHKIMNSSRSLRNHLKWSHDLSSTQLLECNELKKMEQKDNVSNIKIAENQCNICHKIMSSSRSLRCHIKWNHDSSMTSFPKNKEKTESLVSENDLKIGQNQCSVCHKIMTSFKALRNHMKWNHDPNFKKPDQKASVKCDICDRVLYNKASLQTHKIYIHYLPKSRGLLSATELPANDEHEKFESEENSNNLKDNKIQCTICNKTMTSLKALRSHMKWKHDPNFKKPNRRVNIKCDFCDRVLSNMGNLRTHIERVHLGLRAKGGSCPFCATTFPNKDEMLKHWYKCPMKSNTIKNNHIRKIFTQMF